MASIRRVLVIEDDEVDFLVLKRRLGDNVTLTWVQTLEDGIRCAALGGWDFIITDLNLPKSRGMDTWRAVAAAAHPDTPIIPWTGGQAPDGALTKDETGAAEIVRRVAGGYDADKGSAMSSDEIRRLEDRIEAVRTETRDTIRAAHERLNELATDSALAKAERKSMTDMQAAQGEEMERGRVAIREVVESLGPMTGQIQLFGDEMKAAREEKAAEKVAKLAAAAKEEEERKSWLKRWRDAATPQNIVAVVVIGSALGAFANGQITQAELAAQIHQQAIQVPIAAPVAEPEAAPGE